MSDTKKILVIDDEPDVVTFLTTFLEDNGYVTVSACNGAEGFERLEAEKPDLVLLDVSMPERTGVRFYRDVKESDTWKHTPVVMVTGVAKEFEKFIGSRRQVPAPDGYISKPVDKKKLLATIKALVG